MDGVDEIARDRIEQVADDLSTLRNEIDGIGHVLLNDRRTLKGLRQAVSDLTAIKEQLTEVVGDHDRTLHGHKDPARREVEPGIVPTVVRIERWLDETQAGDQREQAIREGAERARRTAAWAVTFAAATFALLEAAARLPAMWGG